MVSSKLKCTFLIKQLAVSPLIIEEERSVFVKEGNNLSLFCTSSRSSGYWTWQREDGKPFSTAGSEILSVKHSVWSLSLSHVSNEHTGNYLCTEQNNTSPSVYRRIKLIVVMDGKSIFNQLFWGVIKVTENLIVLEYLVKVLEIDF